MPWDETEDYIRSGHRDVTDFQEGTLRTITLSKEEGIKAVVGRPKGKETTEIQSYLFSKEKGWTLDKAKAWFEEHRERKTDLGAMSPVTEKILAEPKKVSGILALPGWSRNKNLWTPEEIERLQSAFAGAPIYWEHVDGRAVIGKNEFAAFDPELGLLAFYGDILDEDAAGKIEHGLVKTVSLGVNYARVDAIGSDGQVPRGPYHDGEISLVAVPSVQGTSIQLAEKMKADATMTAPEAKKLFDVPKDRLTITEEVRPAGNVPQGTAPASEPAKENSDRSLRKGGPALEAVWTVNYINNLPDSAFAIVLPGGEKDESGRTVPRSLRKLPYRNANGKVDLPHLRNALARLPQSDLTAEQKAEAQRVLDAAAKEAGVGEQAEEPGYDIIMGSVEDAINALYVMLNELSDRVAALEKPEPEEDAMVPAGVQVIEKVVPEKAPEPGPKETTSQPAAQSAGGDVPNAPPKAEGVVEPGAKPTAPQEFVEKKLIRQLLPDDQQMRRMQVGARTHLEAIRKEVD